MAKNPNKIKNGSMTATVIIYIILAILALICIYPVWYVIIISFSRPIAARTLDVFLIPKGFYTGSYTQLFKDNQMWVTYGNTLIYASVCVVGMLITSAMAAYPLTSPFLFAKKVWVFFILIPMYFSGGLIPQFIIMSKLGMYNTRWAILVPGVVSMWYIILVRTYFATIPEDLRESARIDGATSNRIFWVIILPLSKPIIVYTALTTFLGPWADYIFVSYFMKDNDQNFTIALGLYQLLDNEHISTYFTTFCAGAVLIAIPITILFIFMQRYYVSGVTGGAVKG